jgi:hypothetical protein
MNEKKSKRKRFRDLDIDERIKIIKKLTSMYQSPEYLVQAVVTKINPILSEYPDGEISFNSVNDLHLFFFTLKGGPK